jgi:hypothetical protein
MSRTRLACYLLLAALAGWMACDWMTPDAQRRRPVLEMIKRLWWVPLIIDEPQACHTHSHEEQPMPHGADGYPLVDHRRAL